MYIRKTISKQGSKTYTNYLLVESVATPAGPRQRSICSLGNLEPRPAEKWLELAHKVEKALQGQLSIEQPEPEVSSIVQKAQARQEVARVAAEAVPEQVSVVVDGVDCEDCKEAGPVHVGCSFWSKLGIDQILERAGFSPRSRALTQLMAMSRLVSPASEHAMPEWIADTALADILGFDPAELADDSLYRNLDKLAESSSFIEAALAENERTLFDFDDTIYLYDLTSHYFEGQCAANPQARRGYSRDKRPDCKQVVVGLVINREGFPKAHLVFDGNRQDRTTLNEMLAQLEDVVGRHPGATVVVDRGMAFAENLEQIRARGYHYIVATRQTERNDWLDEFESGEYTQIFRQPSPTNPSQKKGSVSARIAHRDGYTYALCVSEGRSKKDAAIRTGKEKKLVPDLSKLSARIENGKLTNYDLIQQAIGRLRERYPRVARYYDISYSSGNLAWSERREAKQIAESLDGCYLLKTDRDDLQVDEIWHIYSLLAKAEGAFRAMKTPLSERPIFHHLAHRVRAHIFLCILAYHLMVAIELTLRAKGIHSSWASVRRTLQTHQVKTFILPLSDGRTVKVRKSVSPNPAQRAIYDALGLPHKVISTTKKWA